MNNQHFPVKRWCPILILLSMVILSACMRDYWSPGLLSTTTDQGGSFLVWWEPDGSPSYEVNIHYLHSDSTYKTKTADTLYLKTYTNSVVLNALSDDGEPRGFDSQWDPPEACRSMNGIVLFPYNNHSDSVSPFGIKFDSTGAPIAIGWKNFPADSSTVFWVNSAGTELVGGSGGPVPGGPIRRLHQTYLALASGTFPESLRIAPPPDTTIYTTHISLVDSASYWLWIDNYPAGYDKTDNFALVKVDFSTVSQGVRVKTMYRLESGLRWVW